MKPAGGYSGTPLPKKLGLAAGQRALLIGAPPDHPESWGELPAGFAFSVGAAKGRRFDVIIAFVTEVARLGRDLPGLLAQLDAEGAIWVVWPKKTPAKGHPKVASDVSEDGIRALALPTGLVDVKVCAIDGTWSGLKLVIRKALR